MEIFFPEEIYDIQIFVGHYKSTWGWLPVALSSLIIGMAGPKPGQRKRVPVD